MPPTPIGIEWAVTYPIEVKNLGITKLKYQIDTAALETLNQNNFDFRIFEIQNRKNSKLRTICEPVYASIRLRELDLKQIYNDTSQY